MGRKKLSTTVYLDEEQVVGIAAMSKKTGAPGAWHIRKAIDAYLTAAIAAGEITAEDVAELAIPTHAPRPLIERLASRHTLGLVKRDD